ncbi:MAG TPA: hypothetical protein V6D00_13515 [Pantanalinema sp.]
MGEAERLDLNAAARGLDAHDLEAVIDFIGYLRIKREHQALPPVLAEAPLDDEPLTDEDLTAIAEAKADIAAGRMTTAEEMRAEFGL